MRFNQLAVGMSAEFTKTITKQAVEDFAKISGDTNPIHLDESYAAASPFKKPIAHGFLVGSLISAVIANKLPGEGSIYLGQELKFTAPVYFDDTITARVEITELKEDKKIVKLSTVCKNRSGQEVITGSAIIKCS